ncbi:hypothetical protein KKE74_03015 [Patescibacteria group bacterium]|nr:hypothetical protein [Patescibacteria group bacterium]
MDKLIKPGLYRDNIWKGKPFHCHGEKDPEAEHNERMIIYHPDGSTSKTFEGSAFINESKLVENPNKYEEDLRKNPNLYQIPLIGGHYKELLKNNSPFLSISL